MLFSLPKIACLAIAVTAASALMTEESTAKEFRKCNYMMMVKGSGLADTEVQGVRFWSWARTSSASGAWSAIGTQAKLCAKDLARNDHEWLPANCDSNVDKLNSSGSTGSGITGLNTTRARTLLKKTICENHKRSNSKVRTVHDTRKIDGFAVYVRHIGSTSGACRSQPIIDPSYLVIHCRKAGKDKNREWSYKKN